MLAANLRKERFKVVNVILSSSLPWNAVLICLLLATSSGLLAQTDRHLAKWTDLALHDTLRLQAADRLIRKSYWSTNTDSARLLSEQQRELAAQIADPYWVGRSLQNLGDLQLRLAEYEAATLHLRQAIVIYETQNTWHRAGQTSMSLGNTLRKQGLMPEALTALLAGLNYAEEAGERGRRTRGAILNSLGNLYLNQQDFERAAEYYETSLALHTELNRESGIAANLNNLSKVYTEWGRYETARNYLSKSLAIKRKRNDLEGIANTHKNYGDIFLKEQQLDSASTHYHQARTLQDSLGLRGDEASSLADLGIVALARQDWVAARGLCNRGWEQAAKVGDLKVQVKNGDCLTQAYRQLDQPALALTLLEETYTLRDSFLSAGNTRAMEEIRRQYERDVAEIRSISVSPSKLWLGLAGGGLALAGLLFWFFRRRKKNEAQQQALPAAPPTETMPSALAKLTEKDNPKPNASLLPHTAGSATGRDQRQVWVEEVNTLVREELRKQREVTTSSLARQLATSERQLLRRCREATGKTTKQFLQEIRLDYASELITAKQVSTVAELAKAVGFKSPNYFSQRYVTQFGVRPSELLG